MRGPYVNRKLRVDLNSSTKPRRFVTLCPAPESIPHSLFGDCTPPQSLPDALSLPSCLPRLRSLFLLWVPFVQLLLRVVKPRWLQRSRISESTLRVNNSDEDPGPGSLQSTSPRPWNCPPRIMVHTSTHRKCNGPPPETPHIKSLTLNPNPKRNHTNTQTQILASLHSPGTVSGSSLIGGSIGHSLIIQVPASGRGSGIQGLGV